MRRVHNAAFGLVLVACSWADDPVATQDREDLHRSCVTEAGVDAAAGAAGSGTAGAAAADAAPAPDAGEPATACTDQCHYVRAGAAGAGTGADWTDAWTTLPSALQRGHVYFVAAGAYPGATLGEAAPGALPITVKKATGSDHGTSAGWEAAFGSEQASFSGGLAIEASALVLDGMTGGGPGAWTTGYGFKINVLKPTSGEGIGIDDGLHDVVVRHVEVEGDHGDGDNPDGVGNAAVSIGHSTNITVAYAYLHDMGSVLFISAADDSVFDHIYGGKCESTAGEHAEIASVWKVLDSSQGYTNPVHNLTFSNSIYSHVEGTGGLILQTDSASIFGNVFYKPTGDSFDYCSNGVIGTWSGDIFSNSKIFNNTFIDISGSTGCGRAFGIDMAGYHTGNGAFDNLFYGDSPVSFDGIDSHGYNLFASLTGAVPDDPNGVTSNGSPFKNLALAYPAVDFGLVGPTLAGTATGSPSATDPTGITRGADGVWDRGAYEYAP
jgi:hypothetical protein